MVQKSHSTVKKTNIDSIYYAKIDKPDEYTYYNSSIDVLGDTDGDGTPNIVVSSTSTPLPSDPSIENVGSIGIWETSTLSSGTQQDADWLIYGWAEDQRLGLNVEAAGDINGDGYQDFLSATSNTPDVQILPGGLVPPDPRSDYLFQIDDRDYYEYEEFYSNFFMLGDVDGDGRRDLGLHDSDDDGEYFAVYTSLASTPNRAFLDVTWSIGMGAGAKGYDPNSALDLGDLDGDGRAETLISSSRDDAYNTSTVSIIFGEDIILGERASSDELALRMRSTQPSARYGAVVALVGDTDGDGQDDIAIGGPADSQNGTGSGGVAIIPLPR